jgi:hypothetical protein
LQKILFAFTSTKNEPFDRLFSDGLMPTWIQGIEAPNSYLRVIGNAEHFSEFWTKIFGKYEKLRWTKYGRIITGFSKIIFRPISLLRPSTKFQNFELLVNVPECLTLMGFKMLATIEHAKNNNYDFLVLTNSSSLLHTRNIQKYLSNIGSESLYYGGKPLPHEDVRGASGSFVVLNKRAINEILLNRNRWIHALLDDVALMLLMTRLGVRFEELPTLDIKSSKVANTISSSELNSAFHIKCGPVFRNGRRCDDQIMRTVYKRFI